MNTIRRPLFKALLLLFACAALAPRASAHTFHTSLMSMEYNRQEQLLEISLEVFTHDLENILTRRNRRSVRLDRTPDAHALTLAYLQEAVNIKNAAGETKPLTWVGMEAKPKTAVLYFEVKLPEGLDGLLLRNRLFFDLLADQVNISHLKAADKKHTLVFKPGDGFKPLFATNKETPH